MIYKCISRFYKEDEILMNPGDIVDITDDNFTNITTGKTYNHVTNMQHIRLSVEAVTDNIPFAPTTITDNFTKITNKMHDIYVKKNHDYGNSFDLSLDKRGLVAALVRMEDKMNRLDTLVDKKSLVEDESIADTFLDLANYCIMTVMWMDKNNGDF